MTLKYFLLIVLTVATTAIAQTSLKIGASQVAAYNPVATPISQILGFAQSWPILLGIFLYGLSSVFWLFVLTKLDLSLAYPFVGLSFIATMIISYSWLGEDITLGRLTGTILIVCGCALVARSA